MQRHRHLLLVAILGLMPSALVFAPSPALAAVSVDKLQDFSLDQVQITDDYQKNLFSKDITYLITTLDSDRLLAGFKAVSQNANPTNLYGGWEGTNIRGHTMGHWLSAVAHAYQQALGGDATLAGQIKTKLDDVISKLKSYQLSSGYLSAYPISEFDACDNGTGGWVPYYTLHKIFAGLIDVYELEQNADALTIASKLGDWLYARTSAWSDAAKSRVLGQEYGGLNDSLYELYKYTNSANHLTVAHVFDDTGLFTTLAAGTDNLSGRHANMTIPKFIGALNRYRTLGTGEASYLNAASGFLGVVLKDHTYVTGGNSEDEHFHNPNSLDQYRDAVNNETCNVYNMSKLTRGLFMVTGDVKYADYYERVHINEILSSMNPDTGMTTYFKAMGTGYFKVYATPTDRFWCCTGTGMENFTKLGDSVYFHDDKNLWITYYVSSTLNWKSRGLSLTQTTDLPLSNKVTFTVTAAPTDAVSLNFRKPDWTSTCQMAVAVNGQAVTPVVSGGFLSVSRVWQANDKIEVAFPLFPQVSRLQDNQNAVAFTYGPLVLSAGLGTDSMTTVAHGVQVLAATKPNGLQDTVKVSSGTINDWLANIQTNLVQTAGKLEFTPKGTDSDSKLVFIPHYSRYKDRYGIYWLMSGTAGGTATTNLVCPTVTTGGGGSGGIDAGAGGANTGSGGSGAGGASTGSGGSSMTAGTSGSQGGKSGGGGTGSGGAQSSGGVAAGSGGNSSGGAVGHSGSGGASGGGSSGSTASGGSSGNASQSNSGCSCSLGRSNVSGTGHAMLGILLGLGLLSRHRSKRRSPL
jgi:DUF1680 family protein